MVTWIRIFLIGGGLLNNESFLFLSVSFVCFCQPINMMMNLLIGERTRLCLYKHASETYLFI